MGGLHHVPSISGKNQSMTQLATSADWIAVDWGTSNMRAWAMGADNTVLVHGESPKGMGQLSPPEFEPALLEVVETWLDPEKVTPVIACGMVGARYRRFHPARRQPIEPARCDAR